MATDDERRLIEGRLRKLAEKKVPCDIDCWLAEAVMGHDFCETPCDGCLSTVLTRLADLIKPSCDHETCGEPANGLPTGYGDRSGAKATSLQRSRAVALAWDEVDSHKE